MTSLGASAGKPLAGGDGSEGGSGGRCAATGGGGGGTGAGSATGAGGGGDGTAGAGATAGGAPGMGALNGEPPGACAETGGAGGTGAAGAPSVFACGTGGAAVGAAGTAVVAGGAPIAAAAAAEALAAAGLTCTSAGLGGFCGCCARAGQAHATAHNAAAQTSLAQLGVVGCESMGVKFAGNSPTRPTSPVIGVAKMSFAALLQTYCNTKFGRNGCTPLLLLAQAQQLGAFGVDLDLVLHESVHLVGADIDQLEAAPGREL